MHIFMSYLFVAISVAVYFAPSMIARRRMKQEAARVLFLNLVLGWTIAGWIGALSWATKSFGADFRSAENAARLQRRALESKRD